MDAFHCDVYLNPNEFDFLQDPDLNSSSAFYMDVTCVAKCKPILEGKNTIAGFDIEAMYCPGHSIGSTVLKLKIVYLLEMFYFKDLLEEWIWQQALYLV